MVMSQGTYTFLACFAGFWLVWALIVMLCCCCSFFQRRLKRWREERLREQGLRALEAEAADCHGGGYPPTLPPPREPLQFCLPQTLSPGVPLHVPHALPQANWVTVQDTDIFGKPPCYEEAVLMEDPPPPYSEVLADPRGGTYLKPAAHRVPPPLHRTERPEPLSAPVSETSKPPPVASMFPELGYSSLIRLPMARRWDSLSQLLSAVDLNHNILLPPLEPSLSLQAGAVVATMPRQEARTHPEALALRGVHGLQGLQGVQGLRGLEQSCGLPTAFPLLGRSTAV